MATVLRVTPVGVDVRSFGAPWQISGVTVDNPSGSWINIPNVGSVPPYVMGWAANVSPSMLAIDVLFVDSPSGSPSVNIGGPITITLSDTSIASSTGEPSGEAVSQTVGISEVDVSFQDVTAIETGAIATLVSAIPGSRFVPRKATIAINPITLYTIRGKLYVTITCGGFLVFPRVTLTPNTPTIVYDAPRGRTFDAQNSIEMFAMTEPGGGATMIECFLEYIVYAGS